MPEEPVQDTTLNVTMRMKEFVMPPITDALVLGRKSPIGNEAMQRALSLLHVAPFVSIPCDDDEMIEAVLIREAMLKKVPKEKLLELIYRRVRPFMSEDEVIHLDLHPQWTVEDQL